MKTNRLAAMKATTLKAKLAAAEAKLAAAEARLAAAARTEEILRNRMTEAFNYLTEAEDEVRSGHGHLDVALSLMWCAGEELLYA